MRATGWRAGKGEEQEDGEELWKLLCEDVPVVWGIVAQVLRCARARRGEE
jgi:hypothetical protein